MACSRFCSALSRLKIIELGSLGKTKLARQLSTLDLTALGIGSTLGAGIYVIAGQVARNTAGPSVILSFIVAAIASFFAALCYAEFGSRIPLTGSAYVYSYVSIGELVAFIIGWNLILEYVIGTASVARAWSANFDALLNKTISETLQQFMGMDLSGLSNYPDFFALGITLLLTVVLLLGVRESSIINNIFTCINLLVIVYVVVAGAFKFDLFNWKLAPTPEMDNATKMAIGDGGFFPFGVSGVFVGAGTCFYAFVGFDIIATTGEEVKNPQKAIPISIICCLIVCCLCYISISATVTLITPFYLLDPHAPLPHVFETIGWIPAKYIVAAGSLCGLSTSLLGSMFPLPRIIYAMAEDGLLFRPLAYVNQRLKTPVLSCLVSGLFSGTMACLFNIKDLVEMMSIGTLLAYSLVALSIIVMRGTYRPSLNEVNPVATIIEAFQSELGSSEDIFVEERPLYTCCRTMTLKSFLYHMFLRHSVVPSPISNRITNVFVFLLLLVSFALGYFLSRHEFTDITILAVMGGLALFELLILIIIKIQPEDDIKSTFRMPLSPWLPAVSVLINIYLMFKLNIATWYRFAVWMAVGFLIYFAYGIRNSAEGASRYGRKVTEANNYVMENVQKRNTIIDSDDEATTTL